MSDEFIAPTTQEKLDALDKVRLWARAVSDSMQETPGGDAFTYEGGMDDVEALREALDHYQWLFFRVKP